MRRILQAAGYTVTVIDYNAQHLENMKVFGVRQYYGDATRPDMLHAAGIDEAKIFVIAIDDKEKITELAHYIHHNHPNVHLIARAVDRHHVYQLWAAGCRDIIRETYDSSLRMGRSVLEAFGIERETADKMIAEFSDMDRKSMVHVADLYRSDIHPTQNQPYIEAVKEISGPWVEELNRKMNAIRAQGSDEGT